MLTPEEKKNHTHLASKHEAKKGMQRIQFDRFGHLRDKTPIQSVEILMRMFYVRWCLMIMKNKYTRQFEMNSRLETDDNQVFPKENQSKDTTSGKREKKINIPFISVWTFIAVCLVAVLIRFNDVQAIMAPLILVKDCIVSLLMTLWNEIYHIHSLIHFLDNPYAVWILSVILWCAGIVLLCKLTVFGAAILLALIRDHAMPALPGYKIIKQFVPTVALVLTLLFPLNANIYLSFILWFLVLTCDLQAVDFISGICQILFGYRLVSKNPEATEQLNRLVTEIGILRTTFTILKKSAGLKPAEYNDDALHLRCIIFLYRACTFRNTIDEMFNGIKKFWNWICTILEFPDLYRMNTIHNYKIGDETVHFRGGLPVLSYWRKIYVDADDDHTLIVSASKSGKSWSFILILIDSCRMAGESMVINDPKGEILAEKYNVLIEDGYIVRVINFIDPEHSDGWNPLYMIAKSYVDEKAEYEDNKKRLNEEIEMLHAQLKTDPQNVSVQAQLDDKLQELSELHVNHSKSDMYIENLKKQLTYDKDAKDKTWDSSSGDVIAGLIYMLLEEFDRDDSNISIEHINFKSIQALYNESTVMVKDGKDKVTKLSRWLSLKTPKIDKSYDALSAYATAADATRKSIDVAYKKNTNYLNIDEGVQKLLSKSTFDFKDIGREKTVVFIVVHGDIGTYYPLVSQMVDQMYTRLMELARDQMSITGKQRMPIPVTMVLDEFGIFPPLGSIDNIMTFARSAGLRMVMACQDFNQLANTYGEYVSKILQNNSMNFVYLMGQDPDTLQRIENMCGFRLQWSNETGRYEKIPTVTKERLGTLSFGEALIKMQRKNPLITRFRGHDRYIYYKNLKHGYEFKGPKIPQVKVYDLAEKLNERLAEMNKIEQRNAAGRSIFNKIPTTTEAQYENKTVKTSDPGKGREPEMTKKRFGSRGWRNNVSMENGQ